VQRLTDPLDVPLQATLNILEAQGINSWAPLLRQWRASAAGRGLVEAVDARVAAGAVVFPPRPFVAFELTPLSEVKVLVLGQDPYHGPGQAEGLAFSVAAGQARPPSLRNILHEVHRDTGGQPALVSSSGSLRAWARQGVLLLNTALSVEQGRPGSHARLGWTALAEAVCQMLWRRPEPTVFMLWGAHAQAFGQTWVSGSPHLVLRSNHPSPLSARRPPVPFVGNGHFSAANRFLALHGRAPIDWRIP
jgi:uracil-DNA glycosylase